MLITIQEASKKLNIPEEEVYFLIRNGYIDGFKMGREIRVFPDSLINLDIDKVYKEVAKKLMSASFKMNNAKVHDEKIESVCESLDPIMPIKDIIENSFERDFSQSKGVYFLIQDDEIVYVGESKNVYARLLFHYNDDSKKFNKIYFIHIDSSTKKRRAIESYYIMKINPKYNEKKSSYPVDSIVSTILKN